MNSNTLLFNEFQHVGVDYNDNSKVEVYDKEMGSFRDFEAESKNIIKQIDLKPGHRVIELGTGTGNFAIAAAKICKEVFAVDISKTMLQNAQMKADQNDVHNIQFIHAGFLSYEHTGELADTIATKIALHHLPDFWKQIALCKMNRMLKTGGLLYLADQIYSFPVDQYKEKLQEWIDYNGERSQMENFRKDVEMSVTEEYSTFLWIMDQMLINAGFSTDKLEHNDFYTVYLAKKEKEL
ncbi:MAG: methyltransferase domain-containing protein [Candidatus Pacearchaeota archaeon]|nr:methyltransferase domain-containing protein [Candidatus Pacearchaeota archaeon]